MERAASSPSGQKLAASLTGPQHLHPSTLSGYMNATPWLWKEIHEFFDTDDGSLPEVRVNYNDTRATASGYALLRKLAATTSPESPCFWAIADDAERLLDSVPNPAALVVSGEAEAFHVVFGGIRLREVIIPDIGVFVFPNQLALDYRMGAEWGSPEVEAFFALLLQLVKLDPQASLSLQAGILPDVVARFHTAWRRYSTNAA